MAIKSYLNNASCPKPLDLELTVFPSHHPQSLNVSGNNIPVFSARQFSRFGLVNLQRLSASSVGLEAVDGTAFDGLANLIEMDLARNLLTEVSYDE